LPDSLDRYDPDSRTSLSPLKTANSDFPAKEVRGMRNILVNDYDGVNIGIVTDELKKSRHLLNSDSTNSEAQMLRMPKDARESSLWPIVS
jgi:hypothetical protein